MSSTLKKIPDGEGRYIFAVIQDDFEKVDPIAYYENSFFVTNLIIIEDILRMASKAKNKPITNKEIKEVANFMVREAWNMHLSKTVQAGIPKNLKLLLNSKRKREQTKLLRRMRFNPDQFTSFIYWSFLKKSYLFSKYHSEYLPPEFENRSQPEFARIDKDEVHHYGETDMTDGEIKHTINNRKKIIANFFDRDDEWHCFFITYKSLTGNESWENGQPHYHYISDKFGIEREVVVRQLKSKRYNLNSRIHIALDDYLDEE